MNKIPQHQVRALNVTGGNYAPFVLTIRTWKKGTATIELFGFQIENLATEIAELLATRRNQAIRDVARLTARVAEAAAKGA